MGELQRHADHGPEIICRPAFGHGLCEPITEQQAAQLKEWRDAIADLHKAQRNKRGKRPPPEPTGYVKPPPTQ